MKNSYLLHTTAKKEVKLNCGLPITSGALRYYGSSIADFSGIEVFVIVHVILLRASAGALFLQSITGDGEDPAEARSFVSHMDRLEHVRSPQIGD